MSTQEGDWTQEETEALRDEVLASVANDRALRESKRGKHGEAHPRRLSWRRRVANVAKQPVVYEIKK